MRHRITLVGLSCIFAMALIALYAAYRIDVFPNEGRGIHERTIELDEALEIVGMTSSPETDSLTLISSSMT